MKDKEQLWREEFEKKLLRIYRLDSGDYFCELDEREWQGYLAARKKARNAIRLYGEQGSYATAYANRWLEKAELVLKNLIFNPNLSIVSKNKKATRESGFIIVAQVV